MPDTSKRLPVGGMPTNSPVWVPAAVHRSTTLSPSATWSTMVRRASGKASEAIATYCVRPSGPCRSSGREGSCST
jgi:hypothetical protein